MHCILRSLCSSYCAGRILGMGRLGELIHTNRNLVLLTPSFRFDRRFRVYEISDYGETIRTHKRTEADDILDDYILAGPGAPAFNPRS
jgi:hypothetical protein